jgi:hypothetical protein
MGIIGLEVFDDTPQDKLLADAHMVRSNKVEVLAALQVESEKEALKNSVRD